MPHEVPTTNGGSPGIQSVGQGQNPKSQMIGSVAGLGATAMGVPPQYAAMIGSALGGGGGCFNPQQGGFAGPMGQGPVASAAPTTAAQQNPVGAAAGQADGGAATQTPMSGSPMDISQVIAAMQQYPNLFGGMG